MREQSVSIVKFNVVNATSASTVVVVVAISLEHDWWDRYI